MRLTAALKTTLVLALAVHLRHRFPGASIDYWGLAAASAASWIGVPGPGEPVLIATAVIAARHRLDLTSLLLVAWLAATAGGIVGWLLGVRLGRTLATAPGPLHKLRLHAVTRGDRVFEHMAVIAILVTPSWVAGIYKVKPSTYLLTNVVSAAVWAGGIGGGAYLVGPSVIDWADDAGLVTTVAVVLIVVGVVVEEVLRRRRRHARERD